MTNFPCSEVHIAATCNQCSITKELTMLADEYRRWQKGELLQRVVPHMPIDDRELLISGTCGPCFDKLFKEE